MPSSSRRKQKQSEVRITVPLENNLLMEQVLHLINTNVEIATLWKITNVNAIKRLGMTDHGPHHFQIVANNALKIQRLMVKQNVPMSICTDFGLTHHHAEVVVLLASLLHDAGMSIHRIGHEEYSLFLVNTLLREILASWPIEDRTIVVSEVLHAIISHRSGGRPLTTEAGIVRVADALDMTKGRSRIPYSQGKLDIHSVSAMAIDRIEIGPGEKRPVKIEITMNHTAGIFQVDDLLKAKVTGSGIERYLNVEVYIEKDKQRKLLEDFYQTS